MGPPPLSPPPWVVNSGHCWNDLTYNQCLSLIVSFASGERAEPSSSVVKPIINLDVATHCGQDGVIEDGVGLHKCDYMLPHDFVHHTSSDVNITACF